MATIRYFDALGTSGQVITQIDWANLMLAGFGNTATLTDPNGMRFVLNGVGMQYSEGSPSWVIATGTITDLTLQDALGTPLFQVTDTDADAAWLYGWIVSGTDLSDDVNGGPGRLWGTNNTVYGAAAGENLLTGAGDDIVFGGGGDDQLHSTGGNDTFTGGAGADEFVETFGGNLTITDFRDVGPRALQDTIRMTRWEYRNMTREQQGEDTLLTIPERGRDGASHTILIESYDVTRLGVTDFVFGF